MKTTIIYLLLSLLTIHTNAQKANVTYNQETKIITTKVTNNTNKTMILQNNGNDRLQATISFSFQDKHKEAKFSFWLVFWLEGTSKPQPAYLIPPHETYTFLTDIGHYLDLYSDGDESKRNQINTLYTEILIRYSFMKDTSYYRPIFIQKSYKI